MANPLHKIQVSRSLSHFSASHLVSEYKSTICSKGGMSVLGLRNPQRRELSESRLCPVVTLRRKKTVLAASASECHCE
ncbi:hypothetical protein MUK42_34226 [Musa troglodytarum]|uniref:Uncharacterized protein n=1 Tax=Musa troglodytarum TaxID=320322 RepID=A0A9E7EGT3_9LILI|nr:hypothetical protein MUK42_34226 [Musa troglodytarum]